MTITRQYITPNCVLVLEGLNDGTIDSSANDPQSPMSILLNAECRFMGSDKTLKGGRNFFESLLDAVSTHAQECLSGLVRPQISKDKNSPQLVSLEKLTDKNYHRLTVQPEPDSSQQSTSIDLNPVQMFDLVEVVDKFFADTKVLPNLSPNIQPLSKRYRQVEEPAAQRAIPLSLGIGGLALAAGLMVMMPLPQVRKPEPINPTNPTQTIPNSNKLPIPPVVPNNKTTAPTPKNTTTTSPKETPTASPKATIAPTPKATIKPESKVKATVAPTPKTKTAKPEKPTTSP
jgi:hypothetical protein